MDMKCESCGKKVEAIYLKTLARFTKKEFREAEDGDSPDEICVDHYQNIRTTVNLYKIEKHKEGIIFGKQCSGSGITFKKTHQFEVGRPYTIRKVRRERRHEYHDNGRGHRYEKRNPPSGQYRAKVQPPTYYEILGVERNASVDEIKTAFRKCILKWHSDKNKTNDADEYTKILYQARDFLLDPVKRRQYDGTI